MDENSDYSCDTGCLRRVHPVNAYERSVVMDAGIQGDEAWARDPYSTQTGAGGKTCVQQIEEQERQQRCQIMHASQYQTHPQQKQRRGPNKIQQKQLQWQSQEQQEQQQQPSGPNVCFPATCTIRLCPSCRDMEYSVDNRGRAVTISYQQVPPDRQHVNDLQEDSSQCTRPFYFSNKTKNRYVPRVESCEPSSKRQPVVRNEKFKPTALMSYCRKNMEMPRSDQNREYPKQKCFKFQEPSASPPECETNCCKTDSAYISKPRSIQSPNPARICNLPSTRMTSRYCPQPQPPKLGPCDSRDDSSCRRAPRSMMLKRNVAKRQSPNLKTDCSDPCPMQTTNMNCSPCSTIASSSSKASTSWDKTKPSRIFPINTLGSVNCAKSCDDDRKSCDDDRNRRQNKCDTTRSSKLCPASSSSTGSVGIFALHLIPRLEQGLLTILGVLIVVNIVAILTLFQEVRACNTLVMALAVTALLFSHVIQSL